MSDETKWTPGPWAYVPDDYLGLENTIIQGMGSIQQVGGDGFTICQLCDFHKPELSANAHLIAAAPELYEALEWVSGFASGGGKSYGEEPIVKAALAKARGETP